MVPPKKDALGGGEGPSAEEGQGQGQPPQQVINLNMLELPQLQQLRSQIEQELSFYQDAVVQLKEVQVKMIESEASLKKIKEEGKKEMLVPLTGSMFVRGELADVNKMLIDIGTGYYVEKNLDEAIDYFERKIKFLQNQIEKVQSVAREKSQIREAILEIMQGKIAALQAAGKLQPVK